MSTIDPTVKTSRVFDAPLAVFDRLSEVTFPVHPVYDEAPPLFLHIDPGYEDREYVVVQTNNDPATAEWFQSSPAQATEVIVVDVLIRSMYPETDTADPNEAVRTVILRLKEIAGVVQAICWNPATLKPKAIGLQNEIVTGRQVSVEFDVVRTSQGCVGASIVRFGLSAQI